MFEKLDIRTKFGQTRFDVRACGVLFYQGQVLVSNERDGTQTLSGGAVKTGESSSEAVVREFMEESGLAVKVQRLVAIIENFFVYEGEDYQQVMFLYLLSLAHEPDELPLLAEIEESVVTKWLDPQQQLLNLKPTVLTGIVEGLLVDQEAPLQHIIYREEPK